MILFLIILIFFSKVSLAFLPGMPRELSPIIFQSGLHPYMNIFLTGLMGSLVLLKWLWRGVSFRAQSRFYRFAIVIFSLYLFLITFLQTQFVNPDESLILQLGAALMAIFTVFLFGRVIPTTLEPEVFLKWLQRVTITLCWISFFCLLLFPGTSFKGNRFIGVFKHIPHMVSTCTLACFALMYPLFYKKQNKPQLLVTLLNFFLCLFLLVLTGTRSSLAAVMMGLLLCMIIFPSKKDTTRMLKFTVAIAGFLIILFFGNDITNYAVGIARGEQSIGGRAAQDGVATRIEEVERGFEIFQRSPWLGQGLLSKFSSGNDAEVTNYDANKDPHNIIISAGVIGGWGMILIVMGGFCTLTVASVITLRSKNSALKMIAVYMITHLPILFIYHMHLSIGGIADRIYWICFGYMALKEMDVKKEIELKKNLATFSENST